VMDAAAIPIIARCTKCGRGYVTAPPPEKRADWRDPFIPYKPRVWRSRTYTEADPRGQICNGLIKMLDTPEPNND
jgi:hypothetical protein